MSNLETLLTAWLNDGEVPAGFEPSTRVEEYLVAILEGVDDDVTPESRADVLLDAIASKYAGYADGISDLRDETGMTAHHVSGSKPDQIAAFLRLENALALQDLADKGATGVNANTTDILNAYANLPSGGAELNIGYGNTAPEDTTKLWVKTAQPQNVTVDYDIDNGVESVQALTAVLKRAENSMACGVVGAKCYVFQGGGGVTPYIDVYDTTTSTMTKLTAQSSLGIASGCGVVGTKCYIFGGENYGYLNTIKVFDTETNTLTTASATLPQGIFKMGVGVVGTKCYIFGGYKGNAPINTICVYDTENDTITTLSATLPTAARSMGVGVVGTKIYLFGGSSSGGAINTINVFDTTTLTISTLTATIPVASDGIGVGVFGAKCYLFGVNYSNANYLFDTETETVSNVTTTLLQSVGALTVGVVGNSAYLFGGLTGSANTDTCSKFTVTFPLNDGDVYLQTDVFKNKFSLVKSPTEVKTGVSAVYVGNASNEAEYAEALLYDGAAWQPLT